MGMDKFAPPFLRINFDEIEVVQVFEGGICSCFENSERKLSVFKIISKLNFDAHNFIELINEILVKFYIDKIKNFEAFIISLDNLLEFYLGEEEIKEANDIIYNCQLPSLENVKEKIIVFEKLFDNLEIINEKEKKNFIRAIKTILLNDRVLDDNKINTFIEILTQIFDKNIYEEKDSSSQDFEEIMIEKHSDSSQSFSNFSSYSENSQHQIRKMQKEINRLKKLIPKEKDN